MLALIGSYGGAVHPLGDSLAVFRPVPAILAVLGVILLRFRPRVLCLPITAMAVWTCGGIGLAKLGSWPTTPPLDRVFVYQKNMFYANDDLTALAADIKATVPDLVFLQEVSVANEILLEQLRPLYPHQQLCRYSRRSGVAVLSRLPPANDAPFCLTSAGVAGMRVQTKAGLVWAVSLHLTHPYPLNQAGQVHDIAPRLEALEGSVILAGDFNMVPWSHTLRRLAAATRTQRAGRVAPSFYLGPVPIPIDHVLAPGGGGLRMRPLLGSDHRGVLAQAFLWPRTTR